MIDFNLEKEAKELLNLKNFDALGIGVIDFEKSEYQTLQVDKKNRIDDLNIYYDLASLSKIFINSNLYFKYQNKIKAPLKLLLNHRSGLPSFGLLSKDTWREQILSYKIKESETLYSDFGAIRFLLEVSSFVSNPKGELETIFKEIIHYKDLKDEICLPYGFRRGKPNIGVVHDPNAFIIDEFVSHAGLFGTIKGVCATLVKMNEEFDLLLKMKTDLSENDLKFRFVNGFDTAQTKETHAGRSADLGLVFGHLGFTGTSFWIDAKKKVGFVVLTNGTKYYWYDKKELFTFWRALGDIIWKNSENIFSLLH